jgi:hypothetical protein
MKAYEKVKEMLNAHIKETKSENVFIPAYGVGHADRKKFWDSYNVQLVNRINEIKREL